MRFPSLVLLAALSLPAPARTLRVCAEPDNLPFSNDRRQGFENRVVELIGRDLNAEIEYVWFAERRGYARNTLDAGLCDFAAGVPETLNSVLATRPYFRSAYVFVFRKNAPRVASLEDPALKKLRIGVPVVGDDYAPPAYALARQGIVTNVVGFSLFGAYRERDPQARIIEAVAKGKIDVAIAWGPVAGYFARRQAVPLEIVAIPTYAALPELPFAFGISLGVRKGDRALEAELDAALERHRGEIRNILAGYGVPLVEGR